MEEFCSDGIALTVLAERAADSGKEDMCSCHAHTVLNIKRVHIPNCPEAGSIT
jgi:hypothetical protein